MTKEFIDKHALIGRPERHSKDIIQTPARPFSRSLDKIEHQAKTLSVEIRDDGQLVLNTAGVIGDRIRLTKTNAVSLAEWILDIYNRRADASRQRKRKQAKVARQSETM